MILDSQVQLSIPLNDPQHALVWYTLAGEKNKQNGAQKPKNTQLKHKI